MSDLASIVIVNYNYADYIEECMLSAINQSYHNIEIIIVDDGSFDNSRVIIDRYKNNYNNINAIYLENKGQASALCSGVLASRGDVVLFLDSDDVFEENKVATIVNYFNMYNASVVVHPALVLKESLTNEIWPPYPVSRRPSWVNADDSVDDYGIYYFLCSCLSFKRGVVENIAKYKADGWPYRHYGDVYFDRPLYVTENVLCVCDKLTRYRVHKKSHHIDNINVKSKENPKLKMEFMELQYRHVNKILNDRNVYELDMYRNIKYLEILYKIGRIGYWRFFLCVMKTRRPLRYKLIVIMKYLGKLHYETP